MNTDISSIQRYYQFHSKIYDITRWSFLFGRNKLINNINSNTYNFGLEIGCGTGEILRHLKNKNTYGLDISNDMLKICKSKISRSKYLINEDIMDHDMIYDTLILSYSITMMPYKRENIIAKCNDLLKTNGMIYVLDFHRSNNILHNKLMALHNIKIDTKLSEILKNNFMEISLKIYKAYFGVWEYFIFIGKKYR
jgi:S-adenosylmethionine-diacylgycerolhomoserine-N-methlytransferase